MTDLDWTSAPPVEAPVIIQVETDESQHCKVE